MAVDGARRPPIKIGGEWRPQGKGPHDDVEVRVGYALRHVQTLTQMTGGVRLRELRMTEVEDGWRVMFKGDRGSKPMVAYVYADTYVDALVLALTSLDIGQCVWHGDAYPPKRHAKPTIPLRF